MSKKNIIKIIMEIVIIGILCFALLKFLPFSFNIFFLEVKLIIKLISWMLGIGLTLIFAIRGSYKLYYDKINAQNDMKSLLNNTKKHINFNIIRMIVYLMFMLIFVLAKNIKLDLIHFKTSYDLNLFESVYKLTFLILSFLSILDIIFSSIKLYNNDRFYG